MKHNPAQSPADTPQFSGKLAIQQRVLPRYRVDFFDALARACTEGLSVFAGQPSPGEGIETAGGLTQADYYPAQNIHIGEISSPRYLCWQRGLVKWLKGWQPNLLIVEANPRYLSTPRAVRWMHNRHRPVIGWGLGVPAMSTSRGDVWQRMRIARREAFYRQFNGIIAYSQKGASEYVQAGFPPGHVFVAPNAVTFRPAKPPFRRPSETKDRQTVLFVGRLLARKRIDNLLFACRDVPEELQPELVVVGDGPVKAELEVLAAAVYPRAQFIGARHGEELEPVFAATDLFVLPGTGGLAVQQAMAHAIPVIVAEGDGTQDDLVRPESGWRVPAGDLPALTAAMAEALSSTAQLRMMGESAYRIVAEEVNMERMVETFITAMRSVQGR